MVVWKADQKVGLKVEQTVVWKGESTVAKMVLKMVVKKAKKLGACWAEQ